MLDENLVALIDQRIAMNRVMSRATGTCVTRASTGPAADVMFDGSTVAMPVKVLGNVFVSPGDRCLLDKYGTEWIVTGSFSALGLGEASRATFGPSGGTSLVTSSTFVDFQDITPLTFDKAYDGTYVRMAVDGMCVARSGVNTMYFGLRWTPVTAIGYTAADYTIAYIQHDSADVHRPGSGAFRTLGLPAGRYSVQLRWRRQSGAGSLQADGADRICIELDEGVPTVAPIL